MTDIALFIDHDNVQLAAEDKAFDHCASSRVWMGCLVREVERVCGGKVVIRRAYGDVLLNAGHVFAAREWNPREIRDAIDQDLRMQRDLADHGFQMIHCPTLGGGPSTDRKKNRADIFLSLDCIELATKYANVETIAIFSQDSDVSPLCQSLRALGRKVALVTLQQSPPRILRSLATHVVPYDQRALDRYGYDVVAAVLKELLADPQEPLASGVSASAFSARLVAKDPFFAPEVVGFRKLIDLVDACLDDDVVRDGSTLRLRTPRAPSVAVPRATPVPGALRAANGSGHVPSPTAPAASPRQAELLAALRRTDVRPVPELRREVSQWTRQTFFDEFRGGVPRSELTYAQLKERVEEMFADSHSKSKVRDALRMLTLSGAIELEDAPMIHARVVRYHSAEEARRRTLRLLLTRLAVAGVTVVPADASDLCRVAFDEVTNLLLEETARAISERPTPQDGSGEVGIAPDPV